MLVTCTVRRLFRFLRPCSAHIKVLISYWIKSSLSLSANGKTVTLAVEGGEEEEEAVASLMCPVLLSPGGNFHDIEKERKREKRQINLYLNQHNILRQLSSN